jgi:hypothetical protein
MSVWPTASLATSEGELLSISITVAPRRLEALLESLAHAGFPINPSIRHGSKTVVEFPAYEKHLSEVRQVLEAWGFDPAGVQATRMVEEIQAAGASGGH